MTVKPLQQFIKHDLYKPKHNASSHIKRNNMEYTFGGGAKLPCVVPIHFARKVEQGATVCYGRGARPTFRRELVTLHCLVADNWGNTNGAAAKVTDFDRLGKKVRPGTFGKINAG